MTNSLKINCTTGYGDCETCGPYDYGNLKVLSKDDKVIYKHSWNNHLGGGYDPMYEPFTLIKEIINKLGYEVEVNVSSTGDKYRY